MNICLHASEVPLSHGILAPEHLAKWRADVYSSRHYIWLVWSRADWATFKSVMRCVAQGP